MGIYDNWDNDDKLHSKRKSEKIDKPRIFSWLSTCATWFETWK